MAGNTFGTLFQVMNWGESHGKAIGVIVDGCPPLLELCENDIQAALDRRKPGQSEITTQRKESDIVEILSGVYGGRTTGAPISLMLRNEDTKSEDYNSLAELYRPSHADFTYQQKYGIRDPNGGGRSSARLTAGHVAAGAIAMKVIKDVDIIAYVTQVKDITATIDNALVTRNAVDSTLVRCPDPEAAKAMEDLILKTKEEGDSLGGIIECVMRNVPVGLGEPIFDKLEADLAKAMLSINATKGFEIGSGFGGVLQYGSEHNDPYIVEEGNVITTTNNSGGVQGGISNGMPLLFRVAFKPTSTIQKAQQTVDTSGNEVKLEAQGRHDPCVLPRAISIVEAMAALVLCDHYLRSKTFLP